MTDHAMALEEIGGALACASGYRLMFARQVTDAAVADNDTLTFKNVKKVIPVSISNETGDIMGIDASAASSSDWVLTIATDVLTGGVASTRVEGLVLVRM